MGLFSTSKSSSKNASKDTSKADEKKHTAKSTSTSAATSKTAKPASPPKTSAPMHNGKTFIKAITQRRSHYDLTNKLTIPQEQVTDLIKEAVRVCPSSFNVQSSRVVILYGDSHQRVWNITKDALKRVVPEDQFGASEQKVNGCFASGAGTILFYEDTDAIKQQQEQYPMYAANFPIWSQHSSAIAQFAVWSALSQENIGASLQHYNELIADDLRSAFDIPPSWQLIAQMPFGGFQNPAGEKTFIPDEKRFKVWEN